MGNTRSRLRHRRRLCAYKTDSRFGLKVPENYGTAVPSWLLSQQTAEKNSFCDSQLSLVCCASVAVCIQFPAKNTVPHFAPLCPILAFYRLSCKGRAIPMPGMLVAHTVGEIKECHRKIESPMQNYLCFCFQSFRPTLWRTVGLNGNAVSFGRVQFFCWPLGTIRLPLLANLLANQSKELPLKKSQSCYNNVWSATRNLHLFDRWLPVSHFEAKDDSEWRKRMRWPTCGWIFAGICCPDWYRCCLSPPWELATDESPLVGVTAEMHWLHKWSRTKTGNNSWQIW